MECKLFRVLGFFFILDYYCETVLGNMVKNTEVR